MAANATAIWRVRPSGNNNNGGGYDPGIASAGTDFSQQDAAQVTQSGGTITTATVTLTDTGAAFTTALIGNGIRVAGTGITTTWTFITAVPSSTTLTLQTSPGTSGTSVTYSIGGGWANFWTNLGSSTFVVAGNFVYVLGTATPNPASYVYDYTVASAQTFVSQFNGNIYIANDPQTPGYKAPPDTTGGMPTVRFNFGTGASNCFTDPGQTYFMGLWFVGSASNVAGDGILRSNGANTTVFGCVFDQFGKDINGVVPDNGCGFTMLASEIFSSVGAAAGVNGGINGKAATVNNAGITVVGCNIHDCIGYGFTSINTSAKPIVTYFRNSIFAKNGVDGINLNQQGTFTIGHIVNCTIDGNVGNGFSLTTNAQQVLENTMIYNNIISNHTGVGKFGFTCSTGTAAVNSIQSALCDYNVYYNNTADLQNINYGTHDTHGGSNPYVAQSTEDYTLA